MVRPDLESAGTSETIASGGAAAAPAGAMPAVIGRYRIRSMLGRGGMGVVYQAKDPDLRRDVALKVLKDRELAGDAARQRFMQEARSMAQLSHRNIVSVFDIGTHGGQIFIAMELVAGMTLREWMEQPRSWREIRAMFVAAGRGLEAAHAAGVVHRDFKPENVLIGADGRVCVTDFGLARAQSIGHELGRTERRAQPFGGDTTPTTLPNLTTTGDMMGTPAYMSAEQHACEDTDARTDQFSFCVSLYEALYGERPFQGRTLAELGLAVTEGTLHAPAVAKTKGVPRWLRSAVLRGLRANRDDRFASMTELLAELSRDPARTIARAAVVGGLLAATATGSVLLAGGEEDPCEDSGAPIANLWSAPRATAIEKAFAATGVPYAGTTFSRVRPQLDAYATQWATQRLGACRDTRAQKQSQDLFDRRSLCLDHRLASLQAVLEIFEAPSPRTVERAVRTVSELPSLEDCTNKDALLARVPPPLPAMRPAAADLQQALARLAVREPASDFAAHTSEAKRLVDASKQLGYAPLIAEAELEVARVHAAKGDRAAASAMYDAALMHASQGRDDELAATLWVAQLQGQSDVDPTADTIEPLERAARASALRAGTATVGATLAMAVGRQRLLANKLDDAAREFGVARDGFARTKGERSLHVARVLHNIALVHQAKGEHAAARTAFEQSLDIQRAQVGDEHPQILQTESALSAVLRVLGDHDAAIALAKRSVTIREKLYGPGHGEVAAGLVALGNVYLTLGKPEDALAAYERALAIARAFHGEDHTETGGAYGNVAMALGELRRYGDARPYAEKALANAERRKDLRDIGQHLDTLSTLADGAGDLEGSIAYSKRSIDTLVAQLGTDHPTVATSRINLALTLHATKRLDEAAALLVPAIAVWEKAYGKDNARMAEPLISLGLIEIDRGNAAAAIAPLERASALPLRHILRLFASYHLARALAATGADRARVRALAEQARALLADEKALGAAAADPEIAAMKQNVGRLLRRR